ncbi:M48 family metallopeptidase [Niveispirillum fermenti]|uniref:M48 family metallopeptidase n=1 Tax=Niveispirillum fermenti TaxID=1233113 RepID=UPI003A862381
MNFLRKILAPKAPARAKRRQPVVTPPRTLALDTVPVPVEVRVSARSRRLSMRVDVARNIVRVSTPPRVQDADIRLFVERHMDWLHQRLSAVPDRMPFLPDATIPILGVDHVIRHVPGGRRTPRRVALADGGHELQVGGEADFVPRRVADYLKAEARKLAAARSQEKAERLGARVAAVSVRDTRSRWGSCSPGGRLSFCWRLILAPEPVFDYVVAHEVAHLQEMNHSARFWAVCASLTNGDVTDHRDWLRTNGARLHRYGG